MIARMTDELRDEIIMKEEVLLKRNKGTMEGLGVLILGLGAGGFGIANNAFFGLLYESETTCTLVTIVCIIVGLILIGLGIFLMCRLLPSAAEDRAKDNGYTVEEVIACNREYYDEDTLIISADEKLKPDNLIKVGIITENWFKCPVTRTHEIVRWSDIAAAWHDPGNIMVGIIKSNGDYLHIMAEERAFGEEVMSVISQKNPMTITTQKFSFEGKNYDALKQKKEVAELYLAQCAKMRAE